MRAKQAKVSAQLRSVVARSVAAVAVGILLVNAEPGRAFAGNFFGKPGEWLEKRTGVRIDPQTVAKATEKAVQDTGKTLEKAAQDSGAEADRFVENLNRFGREVEKEMCKIFAPGDTGCSVSAGVGVDSDGNATVYDPNNPTERQRPDTTPTGPSDEELAALEEYQNQLAHSGHRDDPVWYKEVDGSTGVAFERTLFAKNKVGISPIAGLGPVVSPTGSDKLRFDEAGDGEFLSSRSGGRRYHAAFDFKATAGQNIIAPIDGYVVRVKKPGKPGLSGLLLVSDNRTHKVTVFYVMPTAEIITELRRFEAGTGPMPRVEAGQTVIGTAQQLATAYNDPRMKDHVHVHVTAPDGSRVSLDGKWVIKR